MRWKTYLLRGFCTTLICLLFGQLIASTATAQSLPQAQAPAQAQGTAQGKEQPLPLAVQRYNEKTEAGDHYGALAAIAGAPRGVALLDLYFFRMKSLLALDYLTDAAEMAENMLAIDPTLYELASDLISLYQQSGDSSKAILAAQRLVETQEKTGVAIPPQPRERALTFIDDIFSYNPIRIAPNFNIFPNQNVNNGHNLKTLDINGRRFQFTDATPVAGWEMSYNLNMSFTARLPRQIKTTFFVNPYGSFFRGPALTEFTPRYNAFYLRYGVQASFAEGPIDRGIALYHTRLFPSSHPLGTTGNHSLTVNTYIRPYPSAVKSVDIGFYYSHTWPDASDNSHSFGPYISSKHWLTGNFAIGSYTGFRRTLKRDRDRKHYTTYSLTPSISILGLGMLSTFSSAMSYISYDRRNVLTNIQEWRLGLDLGAEISLLNANILGKIPALESLNGSSLEGVLNYVPTIETGVTWTFSNQEVSERAAAGYLRLTFGAAF